LLCAGVSAPAAPVDEAGALEEIGVFKPVDFSPGSVTRSQRVALDSRDSKPRWPLAMTCESWLIANPGEVPRECLAIRVARRINSFGVLETMADVMLMRGVPVGHRDIDAAGNLPINCKEAVQQQSNANPTPEGVENIDQR
jgi:hypothetical protein